MEETKRKNNFVMKICTLIVFLKAARISSPSFVKTTPGLSKRVTCLSRWISCIVLWKTNKKYHNKTSAKPVSPWTPLLYINHSINRSINQLLSPVTFWYTQSINQLTTVSTSVFALNCRGLQVLIVFCTVFGWKKSNGTVRWGRGCEGGGATSLGTGYWHKDSTKLSQIFKKRPKREKKEKWPN